MTDRTAWLVCLAVCLSSICIEFVSGLHMDLGTLLVLEAAGSIAGPSHDMKHYFTAQEYPYFYQVPIGMSARTRDFWNSVVSANGAYGLTTDYAQYDQLLMRKAWEILYTSSQDDTDALNSAQDDTVVLQKAVLSSFKSIVGPITRTNLTTAFADKMGGEFSYILAYQLGYVWPCKLRDHVPLPARGMIEQPIDEYFEGRKQGKSIEACLPCLAEALPDIATRTLLLANFFPLLESYWIKSQFAWTMTQKILEKNQYLSDQAQRIQHPTLQQGGLVYVAPEHLDQPRTEPAYIVEKDVAHTVTELQDERRQINVVVHTIQVGAQKIASLSATLRHKNGTIITLAIPGTVTVDDLGFLMPQQIDGLEASTEDDRADQAQAHQRDETARLFSQCEQSIRIRGFSHITAHPLLLRKVNKTASTSAAAAGQNSNQDRYQDTGEAEEWQGWFDASAWREAVALRKEEANSKRGNESSISSLRPSKAGYRFVSDSFGRENSTRGHLGLFDSVLITGVRVTDEICHEISLPENEFLIAKKLVEAAVDQKFSSWTSDGRQEARDEGTVETIIPATAEVLRHVLSTDDMTRLLLATPLATTSQTERVQLQDQLTSSLQSAQGSFSAHFGPPKMIGTTPTLYLGATVLAASVVYPVLDANAFQRQSDDVDLPPLVAFPTPVPLENASSCDCSDEDIRHATLVSGGVGFGLGATCLLVVLVCCKCVGLDRGGGGSGGRGDKKEEVHMGRTAYAQL